MSKPMSDERWSKLKGWLELQDLHGQTHNGAEVIAEVKRLREDNEFMRMAIHFCSGSCQLPEDTHHYEDGILVEDDKED